MPEEMQTNPSARRSWALLATFVVVVGLGAVLWADEAEATHGRGGTMYGLPVGDGEVRLHLLQYWRWSYFGSPPAGSNIWEGVLNYGGGTPVCAAAGKMVVLDPPNAVQDWMGTKLVDNCDGQDGLRVKFPGNNTYTVTWNTCCRISPSDAYGNWHVNHPDDNYYLKTTIDFLEDPYNSPPISVFAPVFVCRINAVCWIDVPNIDPDDDAVDMRWSTANEFNGGGVYYPLGDPACAGCGTAPPAILHRHNQTIEWDTTGATYHPACMSQRTYYSTQVMLEDNDTLIPTPHDPPSDSTYTAKHHKVPVDFLVLLCEILPSTPYWVTPPTPCKQSFTVMAGNTLTFDVQAKSDDPSRIITLYHWPLPPGATVTWTANPGNPAMGTFAWTPANRHAGSYLVLFGGQDDLGAPLKPCFMRITVLARPDIDFTWTFTATAPADLTLDPVQFHDNTTWPASLKGFARTYLWNIREPVTGAPTVSTQHEPRYTYAHAGPSPVCMTVFGSRGTTLFNLTTCKDVPVNNRPPVAAFTHLVRPGTTIADLYDRSSDRDGRIVAWSWQPSAGTPAAWSTQELASGLAFPRKGTYPVNLTVWDDFGAAAIAKGAILIPNRPPTVSPIADVEVRAGDLVRIPIAANDLDLDRLVLGRKYAPTALELTDNGDGTGLLAWRTATGDVGRYRGVEVSAFDGEDEGTWSFTITVYDPARDTDRDGVADVADNCPSVQNPSQSDGDGDGRGDVCQQDPPEELAALQGLADVRPPHAQGPDADHDGVADTADNCPARANFEQRDGDGDHKGDLCDEDADGDGVANAAGSALALLDNCWAVANPDQADADRDGVGDACEGPGAGYLAACGASCPPEAGGVAHSFARLPMGSLLVIGLGAAVVAIAGLLVLRRKR